MQDDLPFASSASSGEAFTLDGLVEALSSAYEERPGAFPAAGVPQKFPSHPALLALVEDLRAVLFPGYFGPSELTRESVRFHIGSTLDRVFHALREQVERGLLCAAREGLDGGERALGIARAFVASLPKVRRALALDARAAYEGDPAATSVDETVFCYPGMLAITNFRIAHELHRLGVPLIPRMITEHAHSITGIDIHPGATIGDRFFIDHGTGVVIGETCVIGQNVRLYQGVTLGAKSFPLDESGHPIKGIPRHPIVEDEVVIYSNATILGRVTIGHSSTIGGNVWLTRSVPPGSTVTQDLPRPERFESGSGI
ncbi:MAG TPA: serine O-acetyltransferase EpsC [Anaeromyxobacteraceae bacterium]|nr:serine O-acetyltransferase EpsC [Anaeromyxobacteraceae bacterium]